MFELLLLAAISAGCGCCSKRTDVRSLAAVIAVLAGAAGLFGWATRFLFAEQVAGEAPFANGPGASLETLSAFAHWPMLALAGGLAWWVVRTRAGR
jgi:hypothetical protein